MWTAADGKLFIAFSALIPLSVYNTGYQRWFPSVTLFINTFVPALLAMVFVILFKAKAGNVKKSLKRALKEILQPKQLLNSIISLFAIFWIVQILLSLTGLGSNYMLSIVLTMLLYHMVQNKLKNKAFYVMIAISITRFVIDRSIYSLTFLFTFLTLIFVWGIIRVFLTGVLSKLGQELFSREIQVSELKQGMILGEVVQKKEKLSKKELEELEKMPGVEVIKQDGAYYVKKPKSQIDLDNYVGEEAEGLTDEQINKIRKLGFKGILVSQTTPFAPLIFLGVILTILCNGNVLILVRSLI